MPLIDDRYELLEVIASGGMATVWRARDSRLGRLVAVKRPHPAAPDDTSAADRMNREARAAAALSHPNLITVYDYGSDEEGPYLVMELAEGPTLQAAMDRLEAGEALDIGAQIADGLTAIHAAGIIHRDVKPANVILSDRGPLLTDFGIALDPTHAGEVTAEGMVVATPSYAAPEVIAGGSPTQASDVYSLAVVVREMLREAGTAPTGALADALEAGTASAPEIRPDARTFGAALRGEAPTVVLPPSEPAVSAGASGSDSTLVMEVPPSPIPPDELGEPEPGSRRFRVPVLLAAILVLLVALALAFRGGDEPGLAAAPSPSTTGVGTTLVSTTTTLVSTSTTLVETTSTSPSTDPVQELRDGIEAILLQPPRSDLNQRDVAKLMDHIDKAIDKARAGDSEKAVDEFEKVAQELDKKLEDGNRDAALAELQRLTESLGLNVEMPDDGQ
ncbi:MAG: serine/threonine-protein kinase [Acidimicrobiia bacterium]